MSRIFERKEGQSNYSPSTQTRMELSRNYHTQYLLCKLTVTHDNSSAVFSDEAVFGLINHLEVVANGNNTIKAIPSKKLYIDSLLGTTKRGVNDIKTADGTNLVSTVWAMIPFSIFNTIRPHDTILNTAVFKTFDLLVNWGSDSSIGSGITVKSAKLDVWSSSLVGYKRNAGETIKYFLENNLTDEVNNTTTDKEIKLPTGKIYKSITVVASVDGKRNDNIIKGLKIKSGTTVIVDLDADALRAKNIFEFKPENYDLMKGIYVIDFAVRGRLSDCLDTTRDFNTLELVLDVEKQAGKNDINVLSDIIQDTTAVEK